MAIIMLVADQLQYDRYNSKRHQIYRVTTIGVDPKTGKVREDGMINSTSPMILKDELEKFTGIESIVRFKRGFGNHWMEFEQQDVNVPLAGYYADPGALQLFEYELEHGDAATALDAPYSVVLTRKAADKLFEDNDPVGKTIKVGELGLYTVTGVLKETENKTHIAFEALASMSSLLSLDSQGKADAKQQDWTDFWSTWTYVQVKEGVGPAELQSQLDKIYDHHISPIVDPEVYKMKLQLQSLAGITPGPLLNNPIGPSLPWLLIYILSGLAAVIMITSCFNFTNLSIARSLTRAKEIGVRKVNGASRMQIFMQFISEAIIVSMCALVISLGLLTLIKPMLLELNFARLFRWDLAANFTVYAIFGAFALLVGLLAGAFPAVVLSSFKPVKVLKNIGTMRLFSRMGLRRVLLITQFTLALIFILSVTVLYTQLDLFIGKDHGFDMTNQISLRINKTNPGPLKNELMKQSNIISASAASHLPAAGRTNADGFKRMLTDDEWTTVCHFSVDEDYATNMKLSVIAGGFPTAKEGPSRKNFIVINEKAVQAFNFQSPADAIGQQLLYRADSSMKTIAGVVKDYNHQALLNKIEPLALLFHESDFEIMQIKYSGSYQDAMASVTTAWNMSNPGLKMDAKDMKGEVMLLYDTLFGDSMRVLGFIAFLAIVISCLGLLGMATYATETRVKEVSIRKVLGSSNGSLVYLLSKGFLAVVGIAIGLGVPAAYFLNTLWLEFLPYHVVVDLPKIAFGVTMLLLFAVITIGSQTWRATFVNPVDNLKSE